MQATTSIKCCSSEAEANEFREINGGNLVRVPTFKSKDGAEKWIKERDTKDGWYAGRFNNSILIDNHGEPLKAQTTERKPGEPTARLSILEKPDYIYCVELN